LSQRVKQIAQTFVTANETEEEQERSFWFNAKESARFNARKTPPWKAIIDRVMSHANQFVSKNPLGHREIFLGHDNERIAQAQCRARQEQFERGTVRFNQLMTKIENGNPGAARYYGDRQQQRKPERGPPLQQQHIRFVRHYPTGGLPPSKRIQGIDYSLARFFKRAAAWVWHCTAWKEPARILSRV
jgi:hypothetical protein